METLQFDYPAAQPARRRVVVGVVGSGDLEVLAEPAAAGRLHIALCSSADGKAARWRVLLDRCFLHPDIPAARIRIHDCGATPGVVSLRLQQALEAMRESP